MTTRSDHGFGERGAVKSPFKSNGARRGTNIKLCRILLDFSGTSNFWLSEIFGLQRARKKYLDCKGKEKIFGDGKYLVSRGRGK